jgi:hypothetical protein
MIRYLYHGQTLQAWRGPGQGSGPIPGERWLPYQPSTFPTPPFPGYSSGHSTFSGAGAEILRLFTGSERFGASASFAAGSSRFEPGVVPSTDLRLTWPTFISAANEAGLSRRYGGIHTEQDDLEGRAAGRHVAQLAWAKSLRLFGRASP